MTAADPMSRSGARWCDQHGRWECASAKQHHANALRGMAYCKNCVGTSTAVAKAKGEANMVAWSLLDVGHETAMRLDPSEVVLRSMRVSVMRAEVLAARVRALMETLEGNEAFVGRTYAAGRDGQRVETGEAIRALVKLENEERDRAVRFAKVAHDMGIDERQLELEQAQAAIVVTAAGAGLEALDALLSLSSEARDVFLTAFLGAIGRPVDLAAAGVDVVAGEVEA